MNDTAASRPQPLLPMAPGRLSRNQVILTVAFALLVLLPGLFAGQRFLSHHEVLAAQPAREMLRDGHWIVQTYVGVPRYEKPPTTSWLIAISMAILHTDAAWAVRLPSIISAVLGIVIIGQLAARWLGSTVGLIAAAMQLTTVWLQTQANLAEADIHIVAAVSAAFALFAIANVEHPRGVINTRLVRIGFMASLGLVFLLKGPAPMLFILAGCLAYVAVRRDWKQLRFFADPLAIAVLVVMLVAWPIAALVSDPAIWQAWIRELTGQARGSPGDSKRFLLYVGNIPLSLFPWVILLIPLAVRAWQRRTSIRTSLRPFEWFLLAWCVPGMLALQIATYKSTHYAYPLLPPCSIAMAAGLVLWIRWQWADRPAIPRGIIAGATALAGIAAIVASIVIRPKLPVAAPAIAVLLTSGLLLAIVLDYRRKLAASLVALFLSVGIALAAANATLIPSLKASPAREQFAQRVNDLVPPAQILYLINFVSDELVWHLHVPMKRIDELSAFEAIPLSDGQLVLTRLRALPWLQQRYTVEELDRVRKPTRADISGPVPLTPVLVRLSAGKPAYDGPSAHPATQAATAPASAPPHRSGESE